jgi:squalene-hopene/tetraprenyl-beta-curcumene cyclase
MKKPVVLLVLLFTFTIGYAQQQLDISLRNEVTLSIQQALRFLEKTQLENGSWSQYPAITALATTAFLRSPFNYTEQNSSTVAKGIQFILKLQQSDGGIYADMMKTYNTAICLMALVATKNPAYDDAIRRARDFLISQQFDEEEGYKPQDEIYGGIG